MNGGQGEKKKSVRSSVACTRCRRSKVKCINAGNGTTCKACELASRVCDYPPPNPASGKRSESAVNGTNIKQENDNETKRKQRRTEDFSRRHVEENNEDPLDASILTRKVWGELLDLFKLHFSTEMSFIHPPTFRSKVRDAAFPRDSKASPTISPQDKLLLLGVLTLTARFHPDLVAHHSDAKSPIVASEYYSSALAATLGSMGGKVIKPSLERIQALLMLALYEWSQPYGLSAWVHLGVAIRLAQSIGLEFQDEEDGQAQKRTSKVSTPKSPEDAVLEKEIRRRTVWSCFFMDRVLSAGKFRPSMMQIERLSSLCLPLPERKYLFVEETKMGFISHAAAKTDGVLSWHVRLTEIFGHFSIWSYAGGRRTETLPPWDKGSKVYSLRQRLEGFHESLPSKLTYTKANLSAHLEEGNATPYISMHILYFLCLIMLHREYIPYTPLKCAGPEGPLDEPTFPKDKYQVPNGFWTNSAENEFRAAGDIIQMIRICQDSNALPESPLIIFAVYQAAFVALYAACFPYMDQKSHVSSPDDGDRKPLDNPYLSFSIEILQGFRSKSGITEHYLKTMRNMDRELYELIQHWKRHGKAPDGGGLNRYIVHERDLKEIAPHEDSERHTSDDSDLTNRIRSRASTSEYQGSSIQGSSVQGSSVQAETERQIETPSTKRPGAWASINGPHHSDLEERQPPHLHQPVPFHQSPNPPSAVPSDTTPSVHSPYSVPPGSHYQTLAQPQHSMSYPPSSTYVMGPPAAQYNPPPYDFDFKNPDLGSHQWNLSSSALDVFAGAGIDTASYGNQYNVDGQVHYHSFLPVDQTFANF